MEEATLPEAPRQPSRWERFTPQLQRAISRAQKRAAVAGLREVQPEHLLEGLLAGGETIPPWVVASLGVDLEPLRRGMAALPPLEQPSPELRLAPRTREVLALAEWEARELDDPGVGTAHALLALLDVESLAAECLWRWQMTREYLWEWVVERSREERLDTGSVEWKLELLPAAMAAAALARGENEAAIARDGLPQWLVLRGLCGLAQCLIVLIGFAGALGVDMTRVKPYGYWLLLWAAEGAWTAFACFYLPRGLVQFERRTWGRLFAFMYVQCAVLTVALLGLPRTPQCCSRGGRYSASSRARAGGPPTGRRAGCWR